MKSKIRIGSVLFCVILIFVTGVYTQNLTDRPNILICIADDASFPFMSAYGTEWINTHGFDRVAREGLLFMNAFTPNAKCAPSRATIVTGRNSWQLEEAANHNGFFPTKFKSFFESLQEHGYYTGTTGKGVAPFVVRQINGKDRELTGRVFNDCVLVPPTSEISRIDYSCNFEKFLDERPEDSPFCFWYGSTEPHRKYEFGSGVNKGGKKLTDIKSVPPIWPDNDSVRNDLLDYAFEVEYFDRHVLKMIEILEKRGELDNTLIIVTSDHGMPFPRIKGQAYNHSNHVPLSIMWKNGIEETGRLISDFISFIDIAPTVLELGGITQISSGMKQITGNSFTDLFKYGENNGKARNHVGREFVLIGKEKHDVGRPRDGGYPIRGIITDEFLYLINFKTDRWPAGNPETGYPNVDGSPTKTVCLQKRNDDEVIDYWQISFGKRPSEELYYLRNDVFCMNNLAGRIEYQKTYIELREKLINSLIAQEDPRIFGDEGDVFDSYPHSNPEKRNFYERKMKGENLKAGWINESDYDMDFKK